MTSTTETLAQEIGKRAMPLTTQDPESTLADLEPLRAMVGSAPVVGFGDPVRGAREFFRTGHRMLRFLVEELGFRVLAIETPGPDAEPVDAYLRTGSGDPRRLMDGLWMPWQVEEFLDVVRWLRKFNERHPSDPVRFAGIDGPDLEDLSKTDQQFSASVIRWHERTGSRVVYWGGIAHAAVGDPVRPIGWQAGTNAGAYLRHRFGSGYVSVGLTFHHGSGRGLTFPEPPPEFAEGALGSVGMDAYLLDLRAEWPQPVREWLDAPARTRVIGPNYTVENHADFHMSGASLREWFDVLVHYRRITTAHELA